MSGRRTGYAAPTLNQNEKGQILGRGVFSDKASGRGTARSQLAELLLSAGDGDTGVVHTIDRLAGVFRPYLQGL